MPNPHGEATLVGQVPANIGGIDAEDTRGPVDINVIDGAVEVSLGTSWATLDEAGTLHLIIALHDAWREARAAAHARQVVNDALPGVWPS